MELQVTETNPFRTVSCFKGTLKEVVLDLGIRNRPRFFWGDTASNVTRPRLNALSASKVGLSFSES